MVMPEDKLYEVLGRYVERPEFRISEVRIGPTQEVPWHFHTNVRDSFLVLEGNIRITMQKPDEEVLLAQKPYFSSSGGSRVTNAIARCLHAFAGGRQIRFQGRKVMRPSPPITVAVVAEDGRGRS
jgi:hypothetical protein